MNPHFKNAIRQAEDEYERLEEIHREDSDREEGYLRRFATIARLVNEFKPEWIDHLEGEFGQDGENLREWRDSLRDLLEGHFPSNTNQESRVRESQIKEKT